MADLYAANWDETDANNDDAAPDGFPEGMAPSGVNNGARAIMGAVKRYVNQQSPKLAAGTGTAFTLTYSVAPGALIDGMTHMVEFHVANGASPTLNINSLGAIPMHYFAASAWRVAPPVLVGPGDIREVVYHSSSGAYRILGPDVTGDVIATARSSARAGTLLCFGQAISRTDYVGLFVAIGTTYGVGDGSTTFNVPDLRGRVAAGKDDMGGSAASRITNAGSGIDGTTLGAAGGGQLSSTMDGPSNGIIVEGSAPVQPTLVGSSVHIHSNVRIVQPTMILNSIIKT